MLDKILLNSEKVFQKLGIKGISMDDLAREMGISKKTLYLYVSDKNDLIKKTFEQYIIKNEDCFQQIIKKEPNALLQFLAIAKYKTEQFSKINPIVIHDLRKYHLEAWEIFLNHKTIFENDIQQNLTTGISQKLYRHDIDIEIISRLYVNLIDIITNPNIFPHTLFDFSKLYNQLIHYHLFGILTSKGLDILKNNKTQI